MDQFKQAAVVADKILEVVRHVLEEHPDVFARTDETYWAMRDIARIEAEKHFAPLAEQHKLLCELAKIVDERYAINIARVREILNNPLIAELLKEEAAK